MIHRSLGLNLLDHGVVDIMYLHGAPPWPEGIVKRDAVRFHTVERAEFGQCCFVKIFHKSRAAGQPCKPGFVNGRVLRSAANHLVQAKRRRLIDGASEDVGLDRLRIAGRTVWCWIPVVVCPS